MKIIFLDFDGVLNSAASFKMEDRKRNKKNKYELPPVNETLCNVCTSNFQYVLDKVPDAKIVISSTWRVLFDLDWLKAKLASYGIDISRVIDKTPDSNNGIRGDEIDRWLSDHKDVDKFVIIDDNWIGNRFVEGVDIVKTTWPIGMTLQHALDAIKILTNKQMGHELHLDE